MIDFRENGLGHCTLIKWMSIFTPALATTEAHNQVIEEISIMRKERESSDELKKLEQELRRLKREQQKEREDLKKKLAYEQLKCEAYSTMIDVAEEQFGIEIRKKAGAKQ